MPTILDKQMYLELVTCIILTSKTNTVDEWEGTFYILISLFFWVKLFESCDDRNQYIKAPDWRYSNAEGFPRDFSDFN